MWCILQAYQARGLGMMNLDSFELYLERGGRKRVTILGHLGNIKRLYKLNPTWDESVENLESTLLLLRRKGLKNISLNRLLLSVKVYSKYLNKPQLYDTKLFKEEQSNKATLSDEELEEIIACPRVKNVPISIWDSMTMFLAIVIFSGCRPGECAKLKVDTVDFGSNTFTFLGTKTGDNRKVPIHPVLIEKYGLRQFVRSKTGYLFPSTRGGLNKAGLPIIGDADWGRNFKHRLNTLGIKRQGVSVYSCRHSYITRMLDADVNLFKVQRIVGHKKIETTAIYTHLSSKQDQQTVQSDPLGLTSVSPEKALQRVREMIESTVLRDNRLAWSFSENEIVIRVKA